MQFSRTGLLGITRLRPGSRGLREPLLLLAMLARVGERNLALAFVLYLPKQAFLVPLPVLMLATIPFHWRLLPIQILMGVPAVLG